LEGRKEVILSISSYGTFQIHSPHLHHSHKIRLMKRHSARGSERAQDFDDEVDEEPDSEVATLLNPEQEKFDETPKPGAWPEVRESFKRDPAFWTILFLAALTQGVQSLSGTATSYLLKDDLNASPAVSSAIDGLAMVPWIIKPIWGFMSDGYPIFGSRRKAYLMLSGFLAFLGIFFLAILPFTLVGVAFCRLLSQTGTAVGNTVAKAMLVEKCEGQSGVFASFLQSFYWISMYSVAVPTTLLGGYMVQHGSKRTMYGLTCIWPLLMVLAAFFLKEARSATVQPICKQLKKLWVVLRGEGQGGYPIWKPSLFVLLFAMGPGAGATLFYFFTEKLHLEPEFIALSGTISTIFSLIGAVVYQAYLTNVSYRTLLVGASIVATFFSALPLLVVMRWNIQMGIPDKAFIATDSAMTSAVSEIALLPLLVLASRICPPGVEGTLYALIMSISNLGSAISNELSAFFAAILHVTKTDFTNLPWLLVISAVCSLAPCALVTCLLPKNDSETFQGQAAAAAAASSALNEQIHDVEVSASNLEGPEDAN